ncbi:MAG: cell division protein ZapE, partial [Pseudomonadota bacterium]
DLFFDCAPFEDKKRCHFHRFMRQVHDELKTLKETRDPLRIVADRLAQENRVICFDEFFVSDIADAMILGTLFGELFRRGVSLVATSNVAPTDLYRDGLQRQRFVPAILLLEQHTDVVHVGGDTDYRLRLLEQAEIYHCPAGEAADTSLQRYFEQIAPPVTRRSKPLIIEGRELTTHCRADGVVWFSFEVLVNGPRSVADYIEIARGFHTVLLSDVPQMSAEDDDAARRFINLVDEFYDRRVKLILSASVPMEALYTGRRLSFEFERTQSRLVEMQSRQYLSLAHIP